MLRLIAIAACLALALPGAVQAQASKQSSTANQALAEAIADPRRNEDRPRDVHRHPAQTLSFFGVAPEMKVGEYAPGGGWYSRLLGLYLGPKGTFTGLFFNPVHDAFSDKAKQGIRDGAAKFPAEVAGWSGLPAERFSAFTLGSVPDGEKGSFDRILVIRMMHNLVRWNNADSEIKTLRDLLKPDGMIGIVQHRAKRNAPFAYTDGSKGYLREADVIRFMEMNGFALVRKSEINANRKDSADWPEGVWTLPPNLRLKEQDKAKYLAIGESDRMTLLFRKRP